MRLDRTITVKPNNLIGGYVVRKKDRKTWWKLAIILTFVFALVIALAKSHQRR